MNLRERRGGDRLRLEAREHLFERFTELAFDVLAQLCKGARRHAIVQATKRFDERRR